ncbi:MAG: hypothetical protein AMDU5_GPLC00018G0008 [Thermoplasmatales archaeon Gpl]|jgi:hypothetical protein|nr:MAG: hypothetical protein AMDU5_GPLC00018G0008 [Thermoplasmatales archaeon Gpl]
MNQNQKTATHIILIPAQIAVHNMIDKSLKSNGVSDVGRELAQIILIGLDVAVHAVVENV